MKVLYVIFLFSSLMLFADASSLSLDKLMKGNERYVNGNPLCSKDDAEKRKAVIKKQKPFALIVSCSDSRVPPEVIFDQNVGDIFVVRVAGNVLGAVETDTVEYGAGRLQIPLILVLGHESCGAVTAVLDGTVSENYLEQLAPLIQPAVEQSKNMPGNRLENAIKENVRLVVEKLKSNPIIEPLLKKKKVRIEGGYYHLDSGKVDLLKS